MKSKDNSKPMDTGTKVFMIVLAILVLIPTFWRIFMHNFPVMSVLSLAFMDVAISALLMFILAVNPLKHLLVYGGLYLAFMASYLFTYPPANFWEWFGTGVVFLLLAYFVFPRLHTLTPYVIIGLFISYIFVIRIMILEMDSTEAKNNLAKNVPYVVAAEAMHQVCGYGNRTLLATERVHWYIYAEDGSYMQTRSNMKKLAGNFYKLLEERGYDYLKINDLKPQIIPSTGDSTTVVVRLSGTVEASPKDAEGFEMKNVVVEPFDVMLRKCSDGHWRIYGVPENIIFTPQ